MTYWGPEELKSIMGRIEQAKEQSSCFIASIMEIAEILEQIQEMLPHFPSNQQRYFQESADELVGLAINHLEHLRTSLKYG